MNILEGKKGEKPSVKTHSNPQLIMDNYLVHYATHSSGLPSSLVISRWETASHTGGLAISNAMNIF